MIWKIYHFNAKELLVILYVPYIKLTADSAQNRQNLEISHTTKTYGISNVLIHANGTIGFFVSNLMWF